MTPANTGERILIVEDEAPMRTALADCLTDSDYRVLTAADGESGLEIAIREKPDLLLLDVMMPQLDGFGLCRELRRRKFDVPVLMLTAKGETEDLVTGLDAGADDYLVKPFSTAELKARVRALLRRGSKGRSVPDMLRVGNSCIDFVRRLAIDHSTDKPIPMTAKEFAMLDLLARHAPEPVSRELFLDVVWGYAAFPTTRTVDNHIAGLRAKLEPEPSRPQSLITVHGVGYRLETPADIANP